MVVTNESGKVLIPLCEVADTFLSRAVGLLLHASMKKGEGLWITPTNSIHTFFMRFAIDAIFIAGNGSVVKIYHDLQPYRMSWIHFRTRAILELAAGEALRLGIREGEVLRLCKEA